jgi:hypothetical protein
MTWPEHRRCRHTLAHNPRPTQLNDTHLQHSAQAQESDVQYDACFSSVDVLQDAGISAVDIQKLKVRTSEVIGKPCKNASRGTLSDADRTF